MILTTLTDLTLDISIWSIKKIYNISYWLIYGQTKSKEQILLEQNNKILYNLIEEQKKNIENLHSDIVSLNEKFSKLCNDIDNKLG